MLKIISRVLLTLLICTQLFSTSNTTLAEGALNKLKEITKQQKERRQLRGQLTGTAQDMLNNLKVFEAYNSCIQESGICMAERCAFAFCQGFNPHNTAWACTPQSQAKTSCFKAYQRKCQKLRTQYFYSLSIKSSFEATLALITAKNTYCPWVYSYERKKDQRCNQNGNNFGRVLSDRNYNECKRILKNSIDCDWYDKGEKDLYRDMRAPDFSSISQPRPEYPVNRGQCGRKISKEELVVSLRKYKNLVKTQWQPKGVVTFNTLYAINIGLGRDVNRDRYLANVKIWKQKVNCYNNCVQAYPRPSQKRSSIDFKQFGMCTSECGKIRYMKCP